MAAVEKRKNPYVVILGNHLLFAVICSFIVMPLSGVAKNIFGVVMALIYYLSLYDFCLREAIYHRRPYTEMKESYIYALKYSIVSVAYIALPVIALLIFDSVWTRLFYLVWDSLFTFTGIFELGENLCKFGPLAFIIVAVLNFGFCFLGYYHGMKDNSLARIINKYIYGGKPPVRKKRK